MAPCPARPGLDVRPARRGRPRPRRPPAGCRLALAAALLLVAGAAAAGPGRSPVDEIARAQGLYDSLQFEGAAQAVAAALARPGRPPRELASLYRLRGLIHAARDDNGRAQADFLRWLELEPDGQLPPGVAPKIVAPFSAAAREGRRIGRLALRPTLAAGALRVEVLGDRARLGQALLLRWAGPSGEGELRADLPGGGQPAVQLPLAALGGGRVRYTLELLGEHGGRLAQAGSLGAPLTIELGGAPLHRRWWLWAAVGGAAALGLGLGLGLGLRR
jgi:hypothetical protein